MPTTPSGTRILPTWMPEGRRFMSRDLADRIGQGGDLFQALRHGFDALGGERQAVDHRRVEAVGARFGDIGGIGGEQFAAALADRRRHGQQRGVLGGRRGARRGARGCARVAADLLHVVFDVHNEESPVESFRFYPSPRHL